MAEKCARSLPPYPPARLARLGARANAGMRTFARISADGRISAARMEGATLPPHPFPALNTVEGGSVWRALRTDDPCLYGAWNTAP